MAPIPVPTKEARELYDRLRNWRKVAKILRRPDGTRFTDEGIRNAVRWEDRGNSGRRI